MYINFYQYQASRNQFEGTGGKDISNSAPFAKIKPHEHTNRKEVDNEVCQ